MKKERAEKGKKRGGPAPPYSRHAMVPRIVPIERVESVSPRSNCSVRIESKNSAIHPVTSRSPKEPREASNISEKIRGAILR